MNSLVVYFSRFGNTRKIAETIGQALRSAGEVRVISTDQLTAADFLESDLVVMGAPTHNMTMPKAVHAWFTTIPRHTLPGTPVAAFDTSLRLSRWLSPFTAGRKLARKLHRIGGKHIVPPESFYVTAREGPLYEGEVERARAWAVTLLKHAQVNATYKIKRRQQNQMKVEEFNVKPLRVHSFLAGIPLHSLDRVELPGGRAGMTLQQISDVVGFGGEVEMEVGPVTQTLFWLRGLIGRILHWDKANELVESVTYIPKLTEDDRARTLVTPGKAAGISRIVYQFENEMLGEIVNRTVHCFWLMATERTPSGYLLWLAVYVRKLNWFTPIYMALISPMLKWIIYPAMLRGVEQRWKKAFPDGCRTERDDGAVGRKEAAA